MDGNCLALHVIPPLQPEEISGLQWQDINFIERMICIEHAVIHPNRNASLLEGTKTDTGRRLIDLVLPIIPHLMRSTEGYFVLSGEQSLFHTQTRKMCRRIRQDIRFAEGFTQRQFRTAVLTDLYNMTKDIKQAQVAACHVNAAEALRERPQRV